MFEFRYPFVGPLGHPGNTPRARHAIKCTCQGAALGVIQVVVIEEHIDAIVVREVDIGIGRGQAICLKQTGYKTPVVVQVTGIGLGQDVPADGVAVVEPDVVSGHFAPVVVQAGEGVGVHGVEVAKGVFLR